MISYFCINQPRRPTSISKAMLTFHPNVISLILRFSNPSGTTMAYYTLRKSPPLRQRSKIGKEDTISSILMKKKFSIHLHPSSSASPSFIRTTLYTALSLRPASSSLMRTKLRSRIG